MLQSISPYPGKHGAGVVRHQVLECGGVEELQGDGGGAGGGEEDEDEREEGEDVEKQHGVLGGAVGLGVM